MFRRRRVGSSPVEEWLYYARNGDMVHVCDDVPERPPGDRRITAVNFSAVESRYRSRDVVMTIKLEGDDRWWTPEQLHVRER